MNAITISMVENCKVTETKDVEVSEVFAAIKGGKWRKQIETIREVYRNGSPEPKRAIDPLKKNLPAVTFSGTFKHREKDALIKHSGLFCADLDSLGDKLPDVRATLIESSKHLFAIFESPSGAGLKAIFRCPADVSRHGDSFRAVAQHVFVLAEVRIDESGKDPARLCFVSFDPDIRINDDASEIEPLPPKPKPECAQTGVADLALRQREAVDLLGQFDWQSETHGFLPCPAKHLHTTGDGERDCEIHLDGVPTLHCFHNSCRGFLDALNHELRLRISKAENSSGQSEGSPVSRDDFFSYMPQHDYIFIPARDLWPALSVNARIKPVPLKKRDGEPVLDENGKQKFVSASAWLDRNRAVEQMTWAPGKPMLIEDRLISEGGWIERHGCRTFNLYRPPNIKPGEAKEAGMWFKHVIALYPNDVGHIIRWLAHRIQKPHEKINHALFLGGGQGIGKDTILYPVKQAVGPWNVNEIGPAALLGRFNGFAKSVLLCINEVHDLGDVDRFALYERLKAYTAAPPDVIRIDEKYLREYHVLNVCGVVLTSNYKTGGLYLPADDRRHYVAWSELNKDDFSEEYWMELYAWYDRGGCRHVATYLAGLDISDFNPKAPPKKADAFWEIVDSNRAPENAELADALEYLGTPDVVTIAEVVETQFADVISSDFADWLKDSRNGRRIFHRFEDCGYVPVRNPDHHGEGRWMIGKKRCVIYGKKTLSKGHQLAGAREKSEAGRQ